MKSANHNLNTALLTRLKDNVLAPGGLFHIDLSCFNIGPRELSVLGDIIKHNGLNCEGSAPILTIDFTNNIICGINSWGKGHFDSDGLTDFCNCMVSLKAVSRLKKFDFSRNYLHVKGMNVISTMMTNGFHSLSDLILKSCELSSEAVEKLAHNLSSNKHLQILDVSENPLGPAGGKLLGDALINNIRLKHLLINSCNIQAEGSSTIFHALCSNSNLEALSINDNAFGDTGAEMIGNMLKINIKLKFLDIQENCIGFEGISAIAKSLTRNHSLFYLGLQWNDISNDGATKIGESLAFNNNLGAIHVLGNHIDIEGIKAIVNGSLNGNTKPIELDLGYCYRPPGRAKAKTERKVIKELVAPLENVQVLSGEVQNESEVRK
jgi:Ran GTPase-activating protein (RanGAP) involved in mRNA processing and transport